jgi:hypothetical protein
LIGTLDGHIRVVVALGGSDDRAIEVLSALERYLERRAKIHG